MLDKINISLTARQEEQEDSPGHHLSILHKAVYAAPSLSVKHEFDMFGIWKEKKEISLQVFLTKI